MFTSLTREEECANVACVPERLRLGWVLSEQEETCTPGESVERPLKLFCQDWSEKRALEDDRFR